MASISPLHSREGRELLDIVDRLRSLPSISHEIGLPQIVVVGQQSSGKSSVLNAISNINFPTNSGFCTQFATEIICRREALTTAKVSIIPSTPTDAQYHARLDAFSQRWQDVRPDQDIAEIISTAREAMGLDQHRRISRDKLRLEFSGPKQDHISLIDLPGLYDQNLPGQREDDKMLVDNMVREYISAEQSIILAVVSGASDIQVQRIFKEFEPYSDRVIGVVTAPDMVEAETDRAVTFQKLVANTLFNAGHQWYIVRNLSHRELRAEKRRDEVEAEFIARRRLNANDVWRNVPDGRMGIQNLKCKLAILLQQSIASRLPGIQRQLHDALQRCEQEVVLLGDERTTPKQQRDYLADRSNKLSKRTEQELQGGTGRRTLRSRIRNVNDEFATNMSTRGATWDFATVPTKPYSGIISNEVGLANDPKPMTMNEWSSKMSKEINDCRGLELPGQINDGWIGLMFLEQSHKWTSLAHLHANEAFEIVLDYFYEITEQVVGLEHAARFMEHAIRPELDTRKKALQGKVTELLSPYVTKNIQTLNQRYCSRSRKIIPSLEKDIDQNREAQNPIVNHTISMLDYYHMALDVFVDNIGSLAIENVLLGGLEDIMTVQKAYEMEEAQLKAIAAESEDVTLRRRTLKSSIQEYEEGYRAISPYAARCRRAMNNNAHSHHVLQTSSLRSVAPEIVIAPAPVVSNDGDTQSQYANSSESSAAIDAAQTPDRRSRTLSTSASSRASSVSSVFTEHHADENGGSQTSSADPSPMKNPYPGGFEVSPRPSKNRSSKGKRSEYREGDVKDEDANVPVASAWRQSSEKLNPFQVSGRDSSTESGTEGRPKRAVFGAPQTEPVFFKSSFGSAANSPQPAARSLFGGSAKTGGFTFGSPSAATQKNDEL